jgi:hypothetical protein
MEDFVMAAERNPGVRGAVKTAGSPAVSYCVPQGVFSCLKPKHCRRAALKIPLFSPTLNKTYQMRGIKWLIRTW